MNILYNQEENRPRAGWRLLIQMVLLALTAGAFAYFLELGGLTSIEWLISLAVGTGFLLSMWISGRYLDKRAFASFGFHLDYRWMRDLLAGLAIAASAMSFIFGVEWITGWIEITGFGWERAWDGPYVVYFAGYFISMLLVGIYEEAVFRGYHIVNLAEGLTLPSLSHRQTVSIAILLSSALFGILHAGNPNATVISTLNIIVAGVVLAYPFVVTGELGMPIGLHIAWNFFQGGIFGFPVSGQPARVSLIQIEQLGPNWLTGGAFGPEAGLLGVGGLVLIAVLTFLYLDRYGNPPAIHDRFKGTA